MGTDRLYQVLPFMRELKRTEEEAIEQFFQNAPDWLLESFRVVELDKKCCVYPGESAGGYSAYHCKRDV